MLALPEASIERILTVIRNEYTISHIKSCKLIRIYTNEVYLLETTTQSYILKIYAPGWREESHIKFELAVLEHLHQKNFPVANAVANNIGIKQHNIDGRHWVLFDFAPGTKPVLPHEDALYYTFGQTAAGMHAALDDFNTHHTRFNWDLNYLITDSLKVAKGYLSIEEYAYIEQLGKSTHAYIEERLHGLDWGVCHGDLTLDNIHVDTNNNLTLYDFDSGGPGWRPAEFRDLWWQQSVSGGHAYDSFLEGYLSVRQLDSENIATIPRFIPAYEIWGFAMDWEHGHVTKEPGGKQAYINRKMKKLQGWSNKISL